MRSVFLVLFLSFVSMTLSSAGSKVRWPQDAFEWEKLDEAMETAVKEEKAICVIIFPEETIDPKQQGADLAFDATNDAISGTKGFCVIVKGKLSVLQEQPKTQEEADRLKALSEGINKAGNSYPIVVVLDSSMKKLVGAAPAKSIHEDGRKVFRELKKQFQELDEAKDEDKKDE
jgi:hypothetical protein